MPSLTPGRCPVCSSLGQRFQPRSRDVGGGRVEVYVSCSKCRSDIVLRVSSERAEWIRRRIAVLERRRDVQISSRGRASSRTLDLLSQARDMLERS